MRVKTVILGSAVLLALVTPGLALAGDAQAGEKRAAVCAACHGKDGIAQINGYPNLAGQNEAYLVSALEAYRARQRTGGMANIMHAQTSGLSDEDIENLAAFYAGLPAGGSE